MSNVSKPNGSNLYNQWRFINAGKVGDIGSDSSLPLSWKFVAGKEVMTKSMDDEVLTTHYSYKDRYRIDVSFDFENFDVNYADHCPKSDASCEDDFGIIEALYSTISEHLEMLQQGTSVENALQPLLDDIAQVLSFGVLSKNLTALLGALSKTLDASLAPDQAITTLESFQNQLQEFPFKQVFDFHRTTVAEVSAASKNDAIGVMGDAPLAFPTDIKWNQGSVPNIKERKLKFHDLRSEGRVKTQPYMDQEFIFTH